MASNLNPQEPTPTNPANQAPSTIATPALAMNPGQSDDDFDEDSLPFQIPSTLKRLIDPKFWVYQDSLQQGEMDPRVINAYILQKYFEYEEARMPVKRLEKMFAIDFRDIDETTFNRADRRVLGTLIKFLEAEGVNIDTSRRGLSFGAAEAVATNSTSKPVSRRNSAKVNEFRATSRAASPSFSEQMAKFRPYDTAPSYRMKQLTEFRKTFSQKYSGKEYQSLKEHCRRLEKVAKDIGVPESEYHKLLYMTLEGRAEQYFDSAHLENAPYVKQIESLITTFHNKIVTRRYEKEWRALSIRSFLLEDRSLGLRDAFDKALERFYQLSVLLPDNIRSEQTLINKLQEMCEGSISNIDDQPSVNMQIQLIQSRIRDAELMSKARQDDQYLTETIIYDDESFLTERLFRKPKQPTMVIECPKCSNVRYFAGNRQYPSDIIDCPKCGERRSWKEFKRLPGNESRKNDTPPKKNNNLTTRSKFVTQHSNDVEEESEDNAEQHE